MDTKASFRTSRSSSTAFSLAAKDTSGTGYDGKTTTMISGNIIRAQMPGVQKGIIRVARNDAIAFGLSDKGYLGSGYDGNYLKISIVMIRN